VNGPDVPLRLAIIANCPARGTDGTRDGCVRDDAPLPDRFNQFVLGNHPVPPLDQVQQEIKHFWFDLHVLAGNDHLAGRGVENY
jgi:hypothetical protein